MIRALMLMTTSLFLLVFYFGALASPLQLIFSTIEPFTLGGSSSVIDGPGVLGQIRTVIFVFVPLIFGAGAIILAFIFAVRLRGTSGPGVNR
jgi:hypothetical protein